MSDQSLLDLWLSIPAQWVSGLSESQLQMAEGVFGFRFPPDYRALLAERLPIDINEPDGSSLQQFPDWSDPFGPVTQNVQWPWVSICLDVGKYNQFWLDEWGEKPNDERERLDIARAKWSIAPRLIPVYGHRYLPAIPQSGNPVLSVYQTDIIYYGWDLESYIKAEFFGQPIDRTMPAKTIDLGLWDRIMDAE